MPEQRRDGPAINTGTVLGNYPGLTNDIPFYDFHSFRKSGVIAHVPGRIEKIEEQENAVRFYANVWTDDACYIHCVCVPENANVSVNGISANPGDLLIDKSKAWLTVRIKGPADIKISW